MNISLSKKQIIALILIIGLFVSIFLTLILVKQSQDIRKKAAGTGAIKLTLLATPSSVTQGQSSTVKIMLRNNTTNIYKIRAAGVELEFDPTIFTAVIPSNGCTTLSTPAKTQVTGNKILLTCMVTPGGSPYELKTGSAGLIELGRVILTAKVTGPKTSTVSFKRTNIPDATGANNFQDFSDAGSSTTINIASVPPKPTPTRTPTPTPRCPDSVQCAPGSHSCIGPNGCLSCCYDPTPTIQCHYYYWFDNNNRICGYKQFCGMYMYLGLRTFGTKDACLAGLGGEEPPEPLIEPDYEEIVNPGSGEEERLR